MKLLQMVIVCVLLSAMGLRADEPKFEMVWSDEFDGKTLDQSKWEPIVNGRGGVVVLSENAGAHAELGEWALTVNPFDVEGQAQAIHEALSLDPNERGRRLGAIQAYVREHDVSRWIELQLAALDRVAATAQR